MTISVGLERISLCVCKTRSVRYTQSTSQPSSNEKNTRRTEKNDDDDEDGDDEMNSLTYSKCRRPTRSTHHFQSWLFYYNFSCDFFFLLSFIFNSFFYIWTCWFFCLFSMHRYTCVDYMQQGIIHGSCVTRQSNNIKTQRCNQIFNCVGVWNVSVCWLVVFAMIICSAAMIIVIIVCRLNRQQNTIMVCHCACTAPSMRQRIKRCVVSHTAYHGATNYLIVKRTASDQTTILFSLFLLCISFCALF